MTNRPRRVEVFDDAVALGEAAAQRFARRALSAVAARGRFTVALAGGRTPNVVYELLATRYHRAVPWHAIDVFWGDERHVPPTDGESNYRAAYDMMLSRVPIPADRVHRIRGELPDARAAAADYERVLHREFALQDGEAPRFDLVLLGLGSDGHTASLFPGSDALTEREKLVCAPWVEHLQAHRITLSLRALEPAAAVVFLVSGAEKAGVLRDVLEGDGRIGPLPAQLIQPTAGEVTWMIDRAAAARLATGAGPTPAAADPAAG